MLTNDMIWRADTSALHLATWSSARDQKEPFNANSGQGERSKVHKATDDIVSPWRRCLDDMFRQLNTVLCFVKIVSGLKH